MPHLRGGGGVTSLENLEKQAVAPVYKSDFFIILLQLIWLPLGNSIVMVGIAVAAVCKVKEVISFNV